MMNNDVSEPPRKKRRIFCGDFDDEPSQYSYEELCRFFELAKNELSKKTQQVKLLKQSNRRLQEKLKTMKSLVEHLLNKNFVSAETTSFSMVLNSLLKTY